MRLDGEVQPRQRGQVQSNGGCGHPRDQPDVGFMLDDVEHDVAGEHQTEDGRDTAPLEQEAQRDPQQDPAPRLPGTGSSLPGRWRLNLEVVGQSTASLTGKPDEEREALFGVQQPQRWVCRWARRNVSDRLQNRSRRELGVPMGDRVTNLQPVVDRSLDVVRSQGNEGPTTTACVCPRPNCSRIEPTHHQQLACVLCIWRCKRADFTADSSGQEIEHRSVRAFGPRVGEIQAGQCEVLYDGLPGRDSENHNGSVEGRFLISSALLRSAVTTVDFDEIVAVSHCANQVRGGFI